MPLTNHVLRHSALSFLLLNGDWSQKQVNFFNVPHRRYDIALAIPKVSPSEDSTGWKAYGDAIQAVLDEEEAEAQADPGRQRRLNVLLDFFDDLKEDLEDNVENVFPSFIEFKNFPQIKPLWQPRDAVFDSGDAAKKLSLGRQVLRDWAEKMRIEAIRHLLAAQKNSRVNSVASNPALYPKSKFGASFFNRAINTFIVPHGGYVTARPWPRSAGIGDNVLRGIQQGVSFKRYKALQAVLAAAELDEATTEIWDLNELGDAFTYPGCSRKAYRSKSMDWFEMVRFPPSFFPPFLSFVTAFSLRRSSPSTVAVPVSSASRTARRSSSSSPRRRTTTPRARARQSR
jgi:hypothetical protein